MASRSDQILGLFPRRPDHGHQVRRRLGQNDLPGRDPGNVQQLVDEHSQMGHLPLHDGVGVDELRRQTGVL